LGAGIAVVAALGVVAVVLLVTRGSASGAVRVEAGGAPRAGQVPPQFSGSALDGTRFDLSGERGRVVVVNFFATWCHNCREELPLLQRTYAQRHGQGLDVVTVDGSDGGDARSFLAPFGITFPALLDPSSSVGHAYLVSDLPTSFFIGRDGRVRSVFHGQLGEATLAESLRGLL
jgi:peroxiredoxin